MIIVYHLQLLLAQLKDIGFMIFQIRKIFILFLFIYVVPLPLIAINANSFLEYSIQPQMKDGKPALFVSLKFRGDESGITEILLPSSWAGQDELYMEIDDLRCVSPQMEIEDTKQPEIKKIHHLPSEVIQLYYQVIPREKNEIEWYYRPLIEESYFFFFGYCFFIVPKIMDERELIPILLEWKNFPEDWLLANSFGAHTIKQELFLPISSFLHAVYVGGDFQILKCGKNHAPIFIAIRGNWSFSYEHLTHLIQTVIESHREFWSDEEFPYYLITVIPTGDDHHMGGTGLFHSFSIFISDLSEENEDEWKWLAWLLSHEHFHTWNGVKMAPLSSSPEGSLFWFTEGFTEYYAVKLNHRTQLIDLKDYVEHINTIMYDYYVSSVHHAPNEKIEKDFWNSWDAQRLPYVRGFLFALKWDQKIRELSFNRYSLDDFMLALFKQAQKNQGEFSLQDIEQVVSAFLPLDIVEKDLRNYIIDGQTIVPKNDFNEVYSLDWVEDMGFNLLQAISKQKIEGVKHGSKAFEAGLRNGQRYVNYQNAGEQIAIDIVDDEGNSKKIIYLKDSVNRLIPQYVLQESQVQEAA